MQYHILMVDDEEDNLLSTKALFDQWGFNLDVAKGCDEAIAKLKSGRVEYAIILMDYLMPGKNGIEAIEEIRTVNTEAQILMFSNDDSRETTLAALRAGAVDYIDKCCSTKDFKEIIENTIRKYEQTTRIVKPPITRSASEELIASIGMVGRSPAMVEVARNVIRYRESKSTVLILGETGVGKEMIASALHVGPKSKYRAINCASYKDNNNLLESELFGHEKGAFTGADSSKVGILQSAMGGTVFFDELQDMGIGSQGKLLRAIETKKIRRVGGNEEYAVDFRIVAGAKDDIQERIKNGTFQKDLYYRLNVLTIEVPPLRNRPADIEPLVSHFCDTFCKERNQKRYFLMRTVRYLERYDWPGNVRELKNVVDRTLTKSDSTTISPEDLENHFFSKALPQNPVTSLAELERRQEEERKYFILNTVKNSNSVVHAATRLGIPNTTLYSIINRYGFKKAEEMVKTAADILSAK